MKPRKPFYATFPDGSSGEIPLKPKTRTEKFLGKIADNPNSPDIAPRTRKERLFNEIWKAIEEIGTNLAPNYNPSSTYEIGDFCRKDGVFYICVSAISEAEEWNPEHWIQTTIAESIVKASQDVDSNAVHYSIEEKTEAAKAIARQNVGAEPKKFVVTVTHSGATYSADKTLAEIIAAYGEGKTILVVYDEHHYYPYYMADDELIFIAVETDGDSAFIYRFYVDDTDSWSRSSFETQPSVVERSIFDTAATIVPQANTVYKCGELTSLTISNPPATGAYSIIFYSGATATTVTGIDGFTLESNKRYRIDVEDGYATYDSWAYTPPTP